MLALKILRKSLVQLPLLHSFTAHSDMIAAFLNEGNVLANLFKARSLRSQQLGSSALPRARKGGRGCREAAVQPAQGRAGGAQGVFALR